MKEPVKAEPRVPTDLSDPAQVDARKKKAKLLNDRRVEGLRFIMGDPRGRAWMRHLISEKLFTRVGGTRPAKMFTGNSTTFYNCSLKELGDDLSAELATYTPGGFRLMEDEGEANVS